jgi:NlpC/P60 family/Bacterial dipeptidyl-peptidase Sh3 domain
MMSRDALRRAMNATRTRPEDTGMPEAALLDRRRNAYRDDLAAACLKGRITAGHYAEPQTAQVSAGAVALLKRPEAGIAYESELVHGEVIDIYERAEGWLWVQARRDSYVGYIPASAVKAEVLPVTHRVVALRSFLYPGPGMKTTPFGFLPFMAEVSVIEESGDWLNTRAGWLYRPHLVTLETRFSDPVGVAERFLGTPYLWGGKSSLGIDCSGLVQTACFACGIVAPRDSDMQEAELGEPMPLDTASLATIPRGALLFWPGHVALSQGGGRMIHANAYHMMVESEEIVPAVARIASKGSALRSIRML